MYPLGREPDQREQSIHSNEVEKGKGLSNFHENNHMKSDDPNG